MSYDWYDSDEFYESLEDNIESAHKCPICYGDGYYRVYDRAIGITDYSEEKCSACDGTGKKDTYISDDEYDWYGW